jgi:peptidyl-prolyl cis-trans isomerase C
MKIKEDHRTGTTAGIKSPACRQDKVFRSAGGWVMSFLCSLLVCSAASAAADKGADKSRTASFAGQTKTGENRSQASAHAGPSEHVVARVNGAAIMSGTLGRMIQMIEAEPARQGPEMPVEPNEGEIRKKALNRLIFQELVFQKATSEGMTIPKEDIDASVESLKARAGGEESYRTQLAAMSKTEDEMRTSIEKALLMERIYKREITDKLSVTEEALKEEYDRNREKFVIPEAITIVDVVFFLDPKSTDSLRKAEEIREKILADKDKDPWSLKPDGTFIVRELGIKKERDEELYPEVRKLKERELSGVVQTHDSLHLIQLKRYSPEIQVQFEQVKTLIEQKLRASAKDERIKKWEAELRKGAKIEIIETQGSKE